MDDERLITKRYENIYKMIDAFLENRPDGYILIYDFNLAIKWGRINKERPDLAYKIALVNSMEKKEVHLQGNFLDRHIFVIVNP